MLGPDDCLRNHGKPGFYGFHQEYLCLCPSSDGGCPCFRSDDCESDCLGDDSMARCQDLKQGTCAPARITFGCACRSTESLWSSDESFLTRCVD